MSFFLHAYFPQNLHFYIDICKWTQEQIVSNTEQAYNMLISQGKIGLQCFTIDGEDIFIFIKSDGTFDTAYGTYKLTIKDFR